MGCKCYNTMFSIYLIFNQLVNVYCFITDFAYKFNTAFKYINFCNKFSI